MRLRQNGLCQLCDGIDIKTTNQFMLECEAFQNVRVYLFSLRSPTPYLVIDFFGLPSINQLQLLIGDHGFYENIGNILDTKVNKCLSIISTSD